MKTNEFMDSLKSNIKKISRKAWISAGAVVIIGVAVLLNFLLVPVSPASDTPELDIPNIASTQGDGTQSTADVFAEMSLSRQQARDEAMEVLKTVTDSASATEDAKTDAMQKIETIATTIECEANIESLIMSKGFENCVAVINGDSASVIVKSEGLLQNQIAQISEIVYEQAGILPSNLNIIESN